MTRITDKTKVMRELLKRMSVDNLIEMKQFMATFLDDIDDIELGKQNSEPIDSNNRKNYVILEGPTRSIKISNLHGWINNEYRDAVFTIERQTRLPLHKTCEDFLAFACGNKYRDNHHLWNAFKKYLRNTEVETKQSQSVSPV